MEKVSIKDLMILEKKLLEINTKYKFQLEFGEAYKLYEYLKKIGSITNYIFLLQDEYHNSNKDMEKLKEYHNKIMSSTVEFDSFEGIKNFVDKITKELKEN